MNCKKLNRYKLNLDKKYQINRDSLLGEGRRSKVYDGVYFDINNEINIECAVKVIDTINISTFEQKLINKEIDILNILRENPHPNIIKIIDIQFVNTEYLIFMEKMDYCLGNLVGKPIKENIVKYIAKNIIEGIKHLRKLSIFHRDIKPDNILTSKNLDKIKIIDFSLSEYGKGEFYIKCGSPMFMSPEITQGLKYDDTSDIFSLGITLYYLLYGFSPYKNQKSESNNTLFDMSINKISKKCKKSIRQMIKKNRTIGWEQLENLEWLN